MKNISNATTQTDKREMENDCIPSAVSENVVIVSFGIISLGPGHAKTCFMPYANNKGADQPAHPRSLISTFVFAALIV